MLEPDRKTDTKAGIAFIGILIAIFGMAMCSSCKKEESKIASPQTVNPVNCNFNQTDITDRLWIPMDSVHADIKFASSGAFYQNTVQYATWSVKGCDSLKIQRPTSVFYYRVQSINLDTLILINPLYGALKYHL